MADIVTISFSKKYMESLLKLPKDIQDLYDHTTKQFIDNPNHNSLYVKPFNLGKNSGIYEFRINSYYRCLYKDLGKRHYLFLYACPHSETNNNRKMEGYLRGTFGYQGIQTIPDEENIAQLANEIENIVAPQNEDKTETLFSNLSDKSMQKLRIPADYYSIIREIPDKEALIGLEESLPPIVYHALTFLAEGDSVSDVIQTLYGDADTEKSFDIENTTDPITASDFITISGIDEYEAMIHSPLELWRIFLHPEQRILSEKNFNGPVKVTGGAGTGKTVTALHRTKWLAEHLPEGKKVLFTTFTTNLAEDSRINLQKLCPDPAIRGRIEVNNLDSWTASFYQQHWKNERIRYDMDSIWENAYKKNPAPELPLSFFKEEWERVIVPNEVYDVEHYQTVSRAGRPALEGGRKKRCLIWPVFQSYLEQCQKSHCIDIQRAMIKCRKEIEANNNGALYESIVVDEGQDLSSESYKLLRAIAGPEHQNDLFIVGDTRQRIYEHKQSFSACGINVRGRSFRLRLNYRTTEEIRKAALHILDGLSFDDMDGMDDPINGYRSLFHGEKPTFKEFANMDDEADYLADIIQSYLDRNDELKNICLTARSKSLLGEYQKRLKARGIPSVELNKERDDRSVDALRLSTMHRVKGLEFNHILIAGADNKHIPPYFSGSDKKTDTQKEETLRKERCLLYVAMTRAKMTVVITSPGTMTEFVKNALDND